MPVLLVRNTLDGPLVLSSDPKGTHFVEWGPAGDEMGNDVQPCPEEFVNLPAFHKQVQRGTLVVENPEDNPEVLQIIERQNKAWRDRQSGAAAKATEVIDPEKNDDIVTLQCVGPNSRGGGQCDTQVPVKDKTKNDKPPLCSTHADLASQFVPDEKVEGNKTIKSWTRVTLGRREKQE